MANPPPIRWHRLLGALLDAVLSPVGVSVETDIAVCKHSCRDVARGKALRTSSRPPLPAIHAKVRPLESLGWRSHP